MIETFWKDLHWSLPLIRVVVKSKHVDAQLVPFLEEILTELDILGSEVDLTRGRGRLES